MQSKQDECFCGLFFLINNFVLSNYTTQLYKQIFKSATKSILLKNYLELL